MHDGIWLLVVRDEPDRHHSSCRGDADLDDDATHYPDHDEPTTSAATIAFTGAWLSEEWQVGLAALVVGSGLVVLARRRRRTPGHAASKK